MNRPANLASLGTLLRLRSNPLWPLVDKDVGDIVAADLHEDFDGDLLPPPLHGMRASPKPLRSFK